MKRLFNKYNKQGNLIIISSYPEKKTKYSQHVCAVGGFSKNIVNHLTTPSIILTTTIGNKKEIYEEKGNLICRVFKRNNLLSYFNFISIIFQLNNIDNILVQFEFASFGDTITTAGFIVLMIFMKLIKKKTFLVMHQVIDNLTGLEGHLGWKKKDIKTSLFNVALKLFYIALALTSEKIIVLEEEFKQRLIQLGVNQDKIEIIPHGVDNSLKRIPTRLARKKLNLPQDSFIILYFGYLTWYKGADSILDLARKNRSKKYQFILAGGPSFTQKNKPHYKEYLKQFNQLPKNVLFTGFVPENKIALYFSACDLVLLPYRSMISSSGPLSLAFSFEKPIMLSNKLLNYKKSIDFRKTMKSLDLNNNDLFFPLNGSRPFTKNLSLLKLRKLKKFSHLMKEQRKYASITSLYLSLIHNSSKTTIGNYDYQLAISNK